MRNINKKSFRIRLRQATSRRVGIDARFYGTKNKGLGRYTKEVVDGVLALDRENEYVVFLKRDNWHEFKSDNPRVKKVLADIRWYTVAEQIRLPLILKREKLDLVHFPHFNVPLFYRGRFIVTIHDLILMRHPTQRASTLSPLVYKIKNFGYRIAIDSAAKRSAKIIAVSEFTGNDIAAKFRVNKDKIAMVYEGIARDLETGDRGNDKKVIFGYNIHRPYLLYVGNAYPHKNLEGLVRVFANLRQKHPDLKLVLVGKEDYFYNRLKDYTRTVKNGEFVVFPGFVPDRELACLYRQALAYVFPSFFEGFGLPPLEAMAHSCPVASSNSTCLPEVLGQAAEYFDPHDENDMAAKIERLIGDSARREQLITLGREQIKKYSWQTCARETLSLYKQVLK